MSLDRTTATRFGTRNDDPPAPDAPEGRTRRLQAAGDERRRHLEALRQEICLETPFAARVVEPIDSGFACLRVVNPEAARLAEDIGCRAEEDGGWWFTWSWGDAISPASDLQGTTAAIVRVLASGD